MPIELSLQNYAKPWKKILCSPLGTLYKYSNFQLHFLLNFILLTIFINSILIKTADERNILNFTKHMLVLLLRKCFYRKILGNVSNLSAIFHLRKRLRAFLFSLKKIFFGISWCFYVSLIHYNILWPKLQDHWKCCLKGFQTQANLFLILLNDPDL